MNHNRNALAFRKAQGSSLPCSVSGCTLHRDGVALYCKHHAIQYRRNGHPLARPLTAKEGKKEAQEVARLLASNPEHPGIVAAADWLDSLLSNAKTVAGTTRHSAASTRGSDELARLARNGVTGLQAVQAIGAVWVYLQRNPSRMPDDLSTSYAMARAFLILAPRPRRTTTRDPKTGEKRDYALKPRQGDLRYFANLLRSNLAPLLANLWTAIQAMPTPEEAKQAAMRAPFAPPRAAI